MQHLSDQDVIAHSLRMWANYVETGNVAMSASDAANVGKSPQRLSEGQVAFVGRLRRLANEAQAGRLP